MIRVAAWHGMHPKLTQRGRWTDATPPIVKGSLLRLEVEHVPRGTVAFKASLWMWWSGDGEPDLALCATSYLRRFDIEHTFRFVKQRLGWTTPALQTPEQADRWTWLVVCAYTQLGLAKELVVDLRMCHSSARSNSDCSRQAASEGVFANSSR